MEQKTISINPNLFQMGKSTNSPKKKKNIKKKIKKKLKNKQKKKKKKKKMMIQTKIK